MACESGSPVFNVVKSFFGFLTDPIGTIIKAIANAIMAGAIGAFKAASEGVPSINVEQSEILDGQVQWLVIYLAVGSLLFACIRMAADRSADAGKTALKGLVQLLVVAGGGTLIVGAVAGVGENFANHLYEDAMNAWVAEIGCGSQDIPAFLLIILAFLLLIAAVIHTIMLYVRLGVMILLMGTLPLAAAASMSDWGGGWWRKHIGWMIAWLLYKPAAALIIYAGSQLMTGSGDGWHKDFHTSIAGICVMLLSAIALPALLKLVVPATGALGGSSAHTKGVMAAAGGVASGAKALGGAAAAAGKGGGGGSGPKGAAGSGGGGSSGGGVGGLAKEGMSSGTGGENAGGSGGGGSRSGSGGGGSRSGSGSGGSGNEGSDSGGSAGGRSGNGGSGGGNPDGAGQSGGGGSSEDGGGSSGGGGRGGGGGGGNSAGPSGAPQSAGAAAGAAGLAAQAAKLAVGVAKGASEVATGAIDEGNGEAGHNK